MPENFSTTWRPTPASSGACPHLRGLCRRRGGRDKTKNRKKNPARKAITSSARPTSILHIATAPTTASTVRCSKPVRTPPNSELVFEAERIVGRLAFLATIAHLWKMTATVSLSGDAADPQRDEVLAGLARSSGGKLSGAVGIARRGAAISHSRPQRHARFDGRVRSPPQRKGDAAGEHHQHLRGYGRRDADDPRCNGPIPRPSPMPSIGKNPCTRCLRPCCAARLRSVRKDWKELLTALRAAAFALRVLGPGRKSA